MKFVGRFILLGIPAVLIILVFIGVFATLFATQRQPERADDTVRPASVFVSEAEPRAVALTVRTQGEVKPLIEIDLTAQVAGRIDYVNPNFVQGGFFEAGETLIRLEDADYRLAVTRAEALVTQRRQQLVREQAESDLAREEWEALGDGEASALTLRQPQLADAQAQLAAAEASLAEARLNLARTRISAPFDGRIRTKLADMGQYVGPGTRLGRVFATETAEIALPLSDGELALLNMPLAFQASEAEPGPEVRLSSMIAGRDRVWEGRIVRTDSVIDPQTRTLSAIVQVDDPYGEAAEAAGAPLAMGLFVDAEITGRQIERAYVLPRSALRGADKMYVAEEGGVLSVRQVEVIDSSPERVVVASGVSAGERVITSPVRGAIDGMAVRALDADGKPLDPEPEAGPEEETEATVAGAQTAAAGR
ncbi:MAG: efflux RND transporter periplasmic adaptor subunit [Oceanicaulis sp.]